MRSGLVKRWGVGAVGVGATALGAAVGAFAADLVGDFVGDFGAGASGAGALRAGSRMTDWGSTSSRRPRNDVCRTRSSPVHSRNCTCATTSGRTHVTPRASAPVGGFANGGVAR